MKRMHLAAFLVLLAMGCSQAPAPDAGSGDGSLDLEVSMPSIEQSADTEAGTDLTSVTLNVSNMT